MSKKKKNSHKNSQGSNYRRSVKFNTGKQAAEVRKPVQNTQAPPVWQKPAEKQTVTAEKTVKPRKNKQDKLLSEKNRRERKKRIARRIVLAAVCAFLVLAALLGLLVGSLTSAQFVEVGERPDLSRFDSGAGALLCTGHGSADSADTSSTGTREIACTFLGFINKKMPVIVRDTVAPSLEVRNLVLSAGVPVMARDFVAYCSDMTGVTFSADGDFTPDSGEGTYTVAVKAEDEGGNVTVREAAVTVEESRPALFAEYGTGTRDIKELILREFPLIYPDSLGSIPAECGEYTLRAVENGCYRLFDMEIKDTLPPVCEVDSFDIVLGETLTAEDVFASVEDASEVSLSLSDLPSFDETGDFTFRAHAEDVWGNASDYDVHVFIHRLNTDVTVEAGTGTGLIEDALFGEEERGGLSLPETFSSSGNVPGEYEVELNGQYGRIPVRITIVDTVPPVLVMRDRVVFVGQDITPDLLVLSCTDGTPVTFEFDHEPRNDKPHSEEMTVIATDAAGNSTEGRATLYIYEDREPPVIYGVSAIYLNVGETASYRNGIYAVDNSDGTVEVSVDSSRVNTSAAGTYFVTYTATDRAGNTSSATARVYVTDITRDTVDSIASGVLANIVNVSMSQRDKALAIFNWVRNSVVYSSKTAYLMGRFNEAAYSGFRTRAGNCYVYYAVTASLLTKAGIENMEIRRNSTTNPHYWNLVKIDGSWYHLDTCPHYAQYPITSFLLTDAEMRDYSTNQAVGYYDFDASLYPPTP